MKTLQDNQKLSGFIASIPTVTMNSKRFYRKMEDDKGYKIMKENKERKYGREAIMKIK